MALDRAALRDPAVWIASGFGAGVAPFAPGTVGSAFAILPYLALRLAVSGWVLVACAVVFAIGVRVAQRVIDHLGSEDPGLVVIDEWVGQWLTLAIMEGAVAVLAPRLGAPPLPLLLAAGFLRSGEAVYMIDDTGRVIAHRNPSVVLRATQFTLPAQNGLAQGLESQWAILATQELEVPGHSLMVVAERNVWNALTLSFLTGVITAGLVLQTWLVATMRGIRLITHIIQPIQDLVETTHAIRSGDLSRRAMVVQQDEVGELAAAFNDMADQLRHTLDGLQEKITELEQISQALRESETRYRSIFENAQEGIYRASKQGRFLMVNPALVHILGYETAEELLNLDITNDLYTLPSDRANLLQLLDEKGQITNMEITWKRKDASQITVSLYTHVLYDNHNQIIGYEGLVFDISQRRKMEQERERLIQELEAKNAELQRFTYTVSHDLKSPLITIRAYLGSLERDVAVGNMEWFRADAQRIVEATNKMQRLLGDLLDPGSARSPAIARIRLNHSHSAPGICPGHSITIW